MVDISAVPDCAEGDIVTILGADGEEFISAEELADKQGSINYEITCDVAPRVPRVYM
jgi:alanine racemase